MNKLISRLFLILLFAANVFFLSERAYSSTDPYYENSPGCVIDRGNPARTGVYKEKLSDHPKKIIWQTNASAMFTQICADNLIITTPWAAFDAENGKKIWDLSSDMESYNYQPTYYKGFIYSDKMMGKGYQKNAINFIKFDAQTGKILEQKKFGIGSSNGLLIYNDIAYVSLYGGVAAYDLKSKKILWERGGIPSNGLSTDGDALFFSVGNGYTGVGALDITTGRLLWRNDHFSGASYLTLDKDYVYMAFYDLDDRSGVVAFNKKTGAVVWKCYPAFVKRGYLTTITIDNNKLFLSYTVSSPIVPITHPMRYSSAGGEVFALDAETGKVLWRTGIAPVIEPISVNHILYIGGQNKLYALDEDTSKERWHLDLEDDATNIIPYRNKLFVKIGQMKDGKLLAIM